MNKSNTWREEMGLPKDPFEKMVDEDIQQCETILNSEYSEQRFKELHIELTAKYSSHINDIGSDMYNCYGDGKSFDTDAMGEQALQHNLFVLKNRLIAFKNYGYKSCTPCGTDKSISIENNLTSTQTQTINISFENVKRQIEDMTGLSDVETKDAIKKIDELKVIVESHEPKKAKWQKAKPILTWLADKSVDVGIAILPLLLKIGG